MNYREEFRRLRSKKWAVKDAHHAAKVNCAFEKAEKKNLVRFRAIPDDLPYDDSYVDTWDVSDAEKAEAKAEIWRRIEREGVWMILTEVHIKCEHCKSDRWDVQDSCGGFLGEDWQDSGYDTDCKLMTLKALGLWRE